MDILSSSANDSQSALSKMLEKLQISDNEEEQNKCLDRILNYLTSADNGKNFFPFFVLLLKLFSFPISHNLIAFHG